MNEVREICRAMLDEPEPPMLAGTEMVSVARRATRRRTARRLAGAGCAGLAGLTAAALIAPSVVGGPATTDPLNQPVIATGAAGAVEPVPDMVAAAQTTLPDLPTPDEIGAHSDQIYSILFAAVPPGFQAERQFGDGFAAVWMVRDDPSGPYSLNPETTPYVAMSSLLLRAGGREGELAAYVWGDRQPAPAGDLCGTEANARMNPIFGPPESCQVITMRGLPMRITVHHDPEQLQVINATWFVRNGFVTVSARQGLPRYEYDGDTPPDASPSNRRVPTYRPPLERPVFTPEQVATIAANPNLLP